MKRYLLFIITFIAVSGTIAAEEQVRKGAFYDAYKFSPQVIRSIWIDMDKPRAEEKLEISGMYQKLSYLVTYKKIAEWAKMPIYRSGPHKPQSLNLGAKHAFGHYNRDFVIWMRSNLIPGATDDRFRYATQQVYDAYIGPCARNYYTDYCEIKRQRETTDRMLNAYREAIASGEDYYFEEGDAGKIILRYTNPAADHHKLRYKDAAFTFSGYIDTRTLLFWLRRSLDGTEAEFVLGLEKLVQAYDRDFLNETKALIPKN